MMMTNSKHPTAKGKRMQTKVMNARAANNFEHEPCTPSHMFPEFAQIPLEHARQRVWCRNLENKNLEKHS